MIPKIPIWLLPWKARKRMAEMQAIIDAEKAAHSETVQQKIAVEMTVETTKAVESKNKHAIGALLAWIYATHKIDQRATDHGLTDILKDFPNQK